MSCSAFSLLLRLKSKQAVRNTKRRATFRPTLEALESREVMSTTGTFTSASDWMGALHEYALRPDGHLSHRASEYGYQSPSSAGIGTIGGTGSGDYWWDTSWQNVSGPQLTQISASRDAYGHAECFGLDTNGSVWVYDNQGSMYTGSWSYLGGANVTQISAANNHVLYALCNDHTMWVHNYSYDPSNWQPVNTGLIHGGPGYVLQISAGSTDINSSNTLWALDGNHAVWELNLNWSTVAQGGWIYYGGWASQISATAHNDVFVLGGGNEVYTLTGAFWYTHWLDTGRTATTISAGTDWTGSYDRVVALDNNGNIWEYSQTGPQAGWNSDKAYLFHYDPAPRAAIAIAASEWAGWGQGDRTMYMSADHSMNIVTYMRESGIYYALKQGGQWLAPTFYVNPNLASYAYLWNL